jgi:hypothetical protein
MKPLFGGSTTTDNSSRRFLLRSTRSLTAYALLSESSKREEINEVLRSVEFREILAHERKDINEEANDENDDNDDILDVSDSDLETTAIEMPHLERSIKLLLFFISSFLHFLFSD